MTENKMTISAGTIARTIILALAIINQFLTIAGISPIPIEDATVETLVSTGWLAISAVWGWWKNNSFTQAARQADSYMNDLKKGVF